LRAIGSKHLLIEFTAEPDLNVSLSKLETEFTKVFNEIVQQGIPEKTIKQIKKRFQGHLNDVLKRKNYRKTFLLIGCPTVSLITGSQLNGGLCEASPRKRSTIC